MLLSLLTLGQAMPVSSQTTPSSATLAQRTQLQATATARSGYLQQQLRQVKFEYYDLRRYPVTDANESHWRNILWTTTIVEPQEAYVAEALQGILQLTQRSQLSKAQQRTLYMAMQVGTQLYLNHPAVYSSLEQQFLQTIERSKDSEFVAIALSALSQGNNITPEQMQQLMTRIRSRFPKWSNDLVLRTTVQDVIESTRRSAVPPLADLLSWTIARGQPHVYVICTDSRKVLCKAVLKDRNGKFVQAGEQGQLWSVPLLLNSIHGVKWNFFRGQTPQGIYRIERTMPKAEPQFFRAYGQFPLVKLFVPFESGVREFLPGRKGRFTGSIKDYQALLPPSWRSYFPIQQTYWAGKMGRSLFRIHGSGDSPDYFSRQSRNPDSYNWNPTIGCLSALELYNEAGVLQQADMPKILNALTAAGSNNFSGYLVVVEMPQSSDTPISLEQIKAAIKQ